MSTSSTSSAARVHSTQPRRRPSANHGERDDRPAGAADAASAPAGRRPRHHRRVRGHRAQGHADHQGRGNARHPDPEVLRPPADGPDRGLPAVPSGGRRASASRRPRAPPRVTEGMVVKTQFTSAGGRESPARHHGNAAGESPARLPDVRQGRRVPAAESGHVQRCWRDPVRRAPSASFASRSRISTQVLLDRERCVPARAAPGSPTRSPATRSSNSLSAARKQQVGIADGDAVQLLLLR